MKLIKYVYLTKSKQNRMTISIVKINIKEVRNLLSTACIGVWVYAMKDCTIVLLVVPLCKVGVKIDQDLQLLPDKLYVMA